MDGFRGKAGYKAVFDERLARLIYAGSDFFLIPSLFEPCGLTAMYSMCYGAVPIVRAVGGLKEIVHDFCRNQGTGFTFENPRDDELYRCVQRALQTRKSQDAFVTLMRRAMGKKFKWDVVAREYLDMYGDAMRQLKQTRSLSGRRFSQGKPNPYRTPQ